MMILIIKNKIIIITIISIVIKEIRITNIWMIIKIISIINRNISINMTKIEMNITKMIIIHRMKIKIDQINKLKLIIN